MAAEQEPPPARGLDKVEVILFVFGIAAFAVLMLAFGEPLAGELYLPIVALWIVGGLAFIWWFHRRLARGVTGVSPGEGKIRRLDHSRRRLHR